MTAKNTWPPITIICYTVPDDWEEGRGVGRGESVGVPVLVTRVALGCDSFLYPSFVLGFCVGPLPQSLPLLWALDQYLGNSSHAHARTHTHARTHMHITPIHVRACTHMRVYVVLVLGLCIVVSQYTVLMSLDQSMMQSIPRVIFGFKRPVSRAGSPQDKLTPS